MKKIDTEKLLQAYIVISTFILVIILANSFYLYDKVNKLEKNQQTEMNALGATANGVRQACNCGVDY